MYKYLVIGVTLIIIWGSGYYMWASGGGEMIRNAYSTDARSNLNPPTIESVAGIYSCGTKTGCNNKYVIFLKDDLTLELMSSAKQDLENLDTNGSSTEVVGEEEDNTPTPERNSIIVNETIPVSTGDIGEMPTFSTTTDNGSTTVVNTTPVNDVTESNTNINSLTETIKDGAAAVIQKGTWNLAQGNILILTLTEQLTEEGDKTLDVPQKLIIKKVEASIFSKISYNKSQYKDMIKPVFVKQHY